ncbi:MAG: hypothetical protein IJP68_03610, partial [Selenomonadaceae bacterium]|nr:hypothetical protein [Selenomonadaceae bacterium]
VKKLVGEYSGNVAVYTGFQQEMIALEQEMLNLGMGSYTTYTDKKTGETIREFKIGETPSIEIKALVLPDIEVSGGSINVSTGDLTGSGKLDASGIPQIDVENNSTVYLVTNKLTIADKGGTINFNGTNVTSNSDIGSGAKFAELKVSDSSVVPTIKVSNNYAGSGSFAIKADPNATNYDKLTDEAKTATLSYDPLNYIEVADDVTNPVGKAIINNTHGSIRIGAGANVNALDIEMTVKKSITQGYTDSVVNIAYDPKSAYADETKKLRDKIGWDKEMPTSDQKKTEKSSWQYSGGKAWEAGNSIYISARDININGLIQAGYKGFSVTITQADLNNATETTFFNGTTMYKVNDGGAKFNKSSGYYTYEPQVYYDKMNNKLYVEDINASGGKVYLAGRISSTGNGKIVVSDGASNIDIINKSSADMSVGKVTSARGEGFIQIVDGEQDKLTEYSSGKTRTIENYSAWLADNTKGKVTESDGLSIGNFATYNPQSGLSYNWTEGTKQGLITHYYYKEEKTVWGLFGDPYFTFDLPTLTDNADAFIKAGYSGKAKKWDEHNSKPADLGNGLYIGNGAATSDNLTLLAENVVTDSSYGGHRKEGPHEHGFLDCLVDYDHYWDKSTDTKQIYQYSLKADYPISVGIIG